MTTVARMIAAEEPCEFFDLESPVDQRRSFENLKKRQVKAPKVYLVSVIPIGAVSELEVA